MNDLTRLWTTFVKNDKWKQDNVFSTGDTDLAISKSILIIYCFQMFSFVVVVNLASEGQLMVGKFTFTSGEFRKAGGDFPHQFIS